MVTTEQHICQHCGKAWTRPPTKGQRPKWCPDCRDNTNGGRAKRPRCTGCGEETADPKSTQCWTCYNTARLRPAEQLTLVLPLDQRSALRRAIEAGNHAGIITAIRERCTIKADGCWLWDGLVSKDGYPVFRYGATKRVVHAVHRLALESKHRQPLGSQPAHHICAVTRCVNPDHLQPVTHRENVAEMLARHAYLARIDELEAALAALDPTHPLLDRIPLRADQGG